MPERHERADTTRWLLASRLCGDLLAGRRRPLHIAHRGRLAWQLADSDSGRVVATLAVGEAVRLPASFVVADLPTELPADPAPVVVGDGVVRVGPVILRPTRWYSPPRPRHPELGPLLHPDRVIAAAVRGWRRRLGSGPGLTPYGDDVLAGALVTLRATGHPIGDRWGAAVSASPLERHTTATSAALLRAAADGWCIDELAGLLAAVAAGRDVAAAEAVLVAVGGSSGAGLLAGVSSVLGAAALGLAA